MLKLGHISCCLSVVVLAAIAAPCDSPVMMPRKVSYRLQPRPVPATAAPKTPQMPVPPATTEAPAMAAPSIDSETAPAPVRAVRLTEPSRKWILPATTWQRMNDSRTQVDIDFDRGQEYVGVRFIIPFGS